MVSKLESSDPKVYSNLSVLVFLDYGRIGPTSTRMTGDTSTSRPSSRAERSAKGPRTPHSYKGKVKPCYFLM